VVDCEGLAFTCPLVFTPPKPESDTEVALFVVQVSVEELPCWMLTGDAVSVHVGAFGVGVTTTTVVLQLTEVPLPNAVRV